MTENSRSSSKAKSSNSVPTICICVGLEPCVIPAVGKPNFEIEAGMMEFGIGHHGETDGKLPLIFKSEIF
jgi:dihydroxyacetone kinase